jgi:hypothetical protein
MEAGVGAVAAGVCAESEGAARVSSNAETRSREERCRWDTAVNLEVKSAFVEFSAAGSGVNPNAGKRPHAIARGGLGDKLARITRAAP